MEGERARPADGAVGEGAALLRRDRAALAAPPYRRGHRLYAAGDVVRLQRIKSLRALGFTLQEVREYLDGSDAPLELVIQLHLARLKERIELQRRLCDRLE